ncbi:MAG: hypothetical protein ACREDX_00850 [Aestuariivirga sp.]
MLYLWPVAVTAGEITSLYTKFDLDHCKIVEKGDEYVYAGTWACKGYDGIEVFQSSVDDRSFAAFGKQGNEHCAFQKTFGPFNTALSPVEWRIRDGKAFAAIERWSMVSDDKGNSVTWLVVNALRETESCHVHYVSGSYPNANNAARRAADTLAPDFDCEKDMPAFNSKIGPPPIELTACKDIARE